MRAVLWGSNARETGHGKMTHRSEEAKEMCPRAGANVDIWGSVTLGTSVGDSGHVSPKERENCWWPLALLVEGYLLSLNFCTLVACPGCSRAHCEKPEEAKRQRVPDSCSKSH